MNKFLANPKIRMAVLIIVIVLALAVVAAVFWKITDIKELIVDRQANRRLIEEANQTIVAEDITITQDQFSTYAAKLYRAMKGPGTNEQAIYTVFEAMNTRSDVQQLVKTYGTKDGETLREWLYGDLSEDEIEHINAIFASKSINYKF